MTKKEQLYQRWCEDKNLSVIKACKELGFNQRVGFRYVKDFKNGIVPGIQKGNKIKRGMTREYSKNNGMIEVFSFSIRTLDQALAVAEVDLEKWQVDRYIINSWEVTMKLNQVDGTQKPETKTNYQVKVWLKAKVQPIFEIAMQELIKNIPKFKFDRVPRISCGTGMAGEICLFDAHFGKFAWGKETGRNDYDLKIAQKYYEQACIKTLNYLMPHKPERIYFILGQDLMHTENFMGKTPIHGNTLDVDNRLPKIYQTAKETVLKCIYLCRDISSVEIIWIPGNHDMHSSFYLCHAIKEHFREDKFVNVDVGPDWRKSRLWGNLLVGWTHQITRRYQSWANELAQAWPEDWGKSKYREWHFGHKHKKMETVTHPVLTEGGVTMRQITALSPIDAWHYQYLFTEAVPGGESFLWTKDQGIVANFVCWVQENNRV